MGHDITLGIDGARLRKLRILADYNRQAIIDTARVRKAISLAERTINAIIRNSAPPTASDILEE